MPSIQAVLFDYGMVLSGPPNAQAWSRIRELSQLEEDPLQRSYWAYRHAYDRGTHTGEEYWQRIARDHNLSFTPEQLAGLIAADVDLWGDLNLSMVEWAAQLQRAGIRTGILSNIGDAMARGLVNRFPWLNSFYHHVWSHEHRLAKPEPEIYLLAARGLETSPEQILFLDDRADNIAAARAIGMQAIHYTSHDAFLHTMHDQGLGWLLLPEFTKTSQK